MRELRHAVEYALNIVPLEQDILTAEDLPDNILMAVGWEPRMEADISEAESTTLQGQAHADAAALRGQAHVDAAALQGQAHEDSAQQAQGLGGKPPASNDGAFCPPGDEGEKNLHGTLQEPPEESAGADGRPAAGESAAAVISREDLKTMTMDQVLYQAGRRYLAHVLKASGGNVSQAARTMGITRQNLQHRLKKYGLQMNAEKINAEKKYMGRIKRLKDRVMNTRPEVDIENAVIVTKAFQETEGQPHYYQKAYSVLKTLKEKSIPLWDEELIVGNSGSKQRSGLVCPDDCWAFLDREIDTINTRPYDPFYLRPEDRETFLTVIKPYWKGRSVNDKWNAQIPDDVGALRDCGILYIDRKCVRGWGELTPDYEMIIKEGVEGIEKRIHDSIDKLDITAPGDYKKIKWLQSELMICEGLRILAQRYSEKAAAMAEKEADPARKAELEKIAEVCAHVPAKPARSFHEAIQSMFFLHTCVYMEHESASYNPGCFDQYMYPYYKADIENGVLTQEEAQELLDCLWVKFSEPCLFQDATSARYSAGYPLFQNLCVGGVDKNGMDAVNDLSYMVLQATMEVQMFQPSLSVKYNLSRNPDKFLKKVVELIQLGTGFPAFHSDEAGILMMLNKGVPLPEAYNWNPCGCVETSLAGKQRCYTSYADYNLGAIVEFALNDGKSRKYDRYVAARTGDPRNFETFEQFLDAVKTQIKYVIKCMVAGNQVTTEIVKEMECPVASLTFKECLESGLDYAWGGAKYSIGDGLDAIGVADLINSILAVKELVYDSKKITMDELLKALEANFAGYEDIQLMCLGVTKYGNDDEVSNAMARDMFNFIADYIESFNHVYGRYTAGILPVSGNTPFGGEVGALPCGRGAYEPLADGLSPEQGTDTNGMSAVIRSVANIPHSRYNQGTLLNQKLDPAFARGEHSVEALMSYLKTLCSLGVFHVQFNVVDENILKEAQQHPEDHGDLLIRVAGYTAFFTELGPETQNDIISRTTQTAL